MQNILASCNARLNLSESRALDETQFASCQIESIELSKLMLAIGNWLQLKCNLSNSAHLQVLFNFIIDRCRHRAVDIVNLHITLENGTSRKRVQMSVTQLVIHNKVILMFKTKGENCSADSETTRISYPHAPERTNGWLKVIESPLSPSIDTSTSRWCHFYFPWTLKRHKYALV